MLLKNAFFLNEDSQFIKSNILIKDGLIKEIGEIDYNDETIVDCEDLIILPGLVNSHFHAGSTVVSGLFRDPDMQNWFGDSEIGKVQKEVFDFLDDELNEDEKKALFLYDYIQLLKQGVTFVSDSSTLEKYPAYYVDALNIIGLDGIIDAYEDLATLRPTESSIPYMGHLLEEEDLSDEEIDQMMKIVENNDAIFSAHCLENSWRKNIVMEKYQTSTIKLFEKHGLLNDNTVLFHCSEMDSEDADILKKYNTSIVHCPLGMSVTGKSIKTILYALKQSANICLGTDWEKTSMWEMIRLANSFFNLDNKQEVPLKTIFKMATVNGGIAYNTNIGKIAPGSKAHLIFLDKNHPAITQIISEELYNTLLYKIIMNFNEQLIKHIQVNGRWVIKNRNICNIDEEYVNQTYKSVINKTRFVIDRIIEK